MISRSHITLADPNFHQSGGVDIWVQKYVLKSCYRILERVRWERQVHNPPNLDTFCLMEHTISSRNRFRRIISKQMKITLTIYRNDFLK